MTTTPNQPDRERAREIIEQAWIRLGFPETARTLSDQDVWVIDAMIAFRDADRAGEGEWVKVPRSPTEAMLTAALYCDNDYGRSDEEQRRNRREEYCAMIASTPATPLLDDETVERCAEVAERDVDWTGFAKKNLDEWQDGPDPVRDYRLGVNVGRCIATAIRALKGQSSGLR